MHNSTHNPFPRPIRTQLKLLHRLLARSLIALLHLQLVEPPRIVPNGVCPHERSPLLDLPKYQRFLRDGQALVALSTRPKFMITGPFPFHRYPQALVRHACSPKKKRSSFLISLVRKRYRYRSQLLAPTYRLLALCPFPLDLNNRKAPGRSRLAPEPFSLHLYR